MHEARIHGRGGQGAVLASGILADALAREGVHVMAIPAFGFERRGAPVVAFLRFGDKPIRQITNIYRPNVVVVIDPTVMRSVDVFAGTPPGTVLVQATSKSPAELSVPAHLSKIAVCDAVHIALEVFKRPITNTIMLGAFAKATGLVSVQSLEQAIGAAHFRDAAMSQNIEAVRRGFAETQVVVVGKEVAA
jgi:phenylglyoxylate dehydrogenase gamma subunit